MTNDMTTIVAAYEAGKAVAEKMMVVGETFIGGMNIAKRIVGDRESPDWTSAMLGAMLVIHSYKDIFTNNQGVITELVRHP